MATKYSIHNQLTGLQEEALTFEDAKLLQEKIKNEWLEFNKNLFLITILIQNEDGFWTQTLADENGNPISPVSFDPINEGI